VELLNLKMKKKEEEPVKLREPYIEKISEG
jgi:hypothetical protein